MRELKTTTLITDRALIASVPGLSPSVLFALRHWKAILLCAMLIVTAVSVGGAWKYHGYMNKKLVRVNVRVNKLQTENDGMRLVIKQTQEDVETSNLRFDQFNNDIAALRRSTAELRGKIGSLPRNTQPGTPPEQAQTLLDEIRTDINSRWSKIGTKP